MVVWAELAALILYLGPLLLFSVARFSSDRPAWAMALDLPLAVAIDLLGILILTRLVTLEVAVLLSRPIWIAGCGFVIRRRRKRDPVRWPRALGYGTVSMVAIAAVAATYLSRTLSRGFTLWDRYMHIPMVTSLRGQSLPFRHVFQSSDVLHYHFSGDVLAAELQTLSFDVINASLALSLAHDFLFAATAVSAALLFRDFGLRRGAPSVAASIGLLLLGPLVFLRGGIGVPYVGYSYHAYLTLSFRPHIALAGLLFVGIAGSIAARLLARRRGIPVSETLPALLGCVALLAITDEASVGLLGLALGVSWLVLPDVVAPTRLRGVVIFLSLAVAVIVPNYVFAASLARGGPVTSVALVAARMPGFVNGPLPIAPGTSKAVLFSDGFPMLASTLGLFALLLLAPSRRMAAMFALAAALTALALFSLLRVEVNHDAEESQRFMTAAFFVVPLLGLLSVERAPGSVGALIVFASVLFPAFATVVWLRDGPAHDPNGLESQQSLHAHPPRARDALRCRLPQPHGRPLR